MKVVIIVFLVIDVLLVAGAAIRVGTSTNTTQPFVDFMGTATLHEEEPDSGRSTPSSTGSGEVMTRAGEAEVTAFMSANPSPGGNASGNVDASIDRATSIEDGRVDDLEGAKKEISEIGK